MTCVVASRNANTIATNARKMMCWMRRMDSYNTMILPNANNTYDSQSIAIGKGDSANPNTV